MPGPITYAAVTLLARDRIGQIRRALAAKKSAGTSRELERHVLHLAAEAERIMMSAGPTIDPPVRLYGPPLTDQVSRFLLLGAVGPELARYAAYFVPGQRWLADTLHKGTPDEHREKVLANSTNLVFDFWKRVGPMIKDEFVLDKKHEPALDQMRAYVLGHVCHIATDVLSHPYFEAVEARLATPGPPAVRFMGRDDVAAALDVRVSAKFFGRGTDTRTKQWADWFPSPGDVPKSFARAMAESIESLYGARAEGLPAFEDAFKELSPAPPALGKGLIEESLEYFHNIIEIERVWTFGDWLGATAAMFLPMAFAYPAALSLTFGKDLSRVLTEKEDGPDAKKIRTYESVTFPLAMASLLGPLVTMIIVSASGRKLRAEGITGWVQAGLSTVLGGTFFRTRGKAGPGLWTVWFALPVVLAVAQFIFVFVRGAKENSRKLLWLGPIMQLGLALVFMLLYHVWLHEGVEELDKDADERDDGKAFGYFVAWILIVVAHWFLFTILGRWAFSASVPEDQDALATGEPREFLRLYDDVALVHDPKAALASEKLADLVYPPARRPLLKLRWEKAAAASVQLKIDPERHDRLVFRWDPADKVGQTFFGPIAPTTVGAFGTLLAAAVTGNGAKGKLHVKPAHDDEKDLELSPGALFADHGDDQTTVADHKKKTEEADGFKDVGISEATAFTLFHTPRPRLAQRMGRNGVVPDGQRTARPSAGGSLLQLVPGNPLKVTIVGAGTSGVGVALFTVQNGTGPVSAPPQLTAPEVVLPELRTTLFFTPPNFVAGNSWTITPDGKVTPAPGNTSTGGLAAKITPAYHATNATGGKSPLLRQLFLPGDVIEITSAPAAQRRVVERVINDTDLIVASGFTAAIAEAGIGYSRVASDRGVRVRGASTVQIPTLTLGVGPNDLEGVTLASPFGAQFKVGDVVELVVPPPPAPTPPPPPVLRTIVAIRDGALVGPAAAAKNLLELDAPPPAFSGAINIDRLSDVEADGFPFIAEPNDVFGDGGSVMNDAADLAALLCLGAVSRLAKNDTPVKPDEKVDKQPVHRVYQVFRNWNLDRRRINEWKLLVSGGATSERRGDFDVADEAAPIGDAEDAKAPGAALKELRQAGDAIVSEHGWLPVFRSWVDMAGRARTDTGSTEVFRPGSLSNRDLSRAMAYLLDAPKEVTP